MNTKDAIRSSVDLCSTVLTTYLGDLDDADLMRRPGKNCNHLAWQLGHLIASEVALLEMVAPGRGTTLPDGFAEAHAKEHCGNDDPAAFRDKQTYLDLFAEVRAATRAALDAYPEPDFDNPGPEHFRAVCPTMGSMFTLIATHPMMHAGQFAVVRRELGKPILM